MQKQCTIGTPVSYNGSIIDYLMTLNMLDKELIEEQKLVCEEFGSAYLPVKEDDVVAIALHTLNKEPIVGLRKAPDENKVSWFIYGGELGEGEEFFEIITVKALDKEFPDALPYLALDTGYRFMMDSDDYEDVWKEGDEA